MAKDEKTRWDLATLKLHIVQVRIENEKLLAMYEQTKQLERIADNLGDISGSAQAMEPNTRKF